MTLVIQILALPFGLIYWLITTVRNIFFSARIFPSKSYEFPLISVGNLSVGGTGKTPHTEYLIRLLQNKYKVATLSRGYGRNSKGYRLSGESDSATSLGDEPFQLHKKFPKIQVAVAEKRQVGIQQLIQLKNKPDLILLDDAYQHRAVKPGLNILLTEYKRPYIKDYIMPVGRLRESRRGAQRADIIIVTKCPSSLTPLEMRSFTIDLKLEDYQQIYYSYLKYDQLHPLNPEAEQLNLNYADLKQVDTCLLTAIAKPKEIQEYIKLANPQCDFMSFPDHYFFRDKDYAAINKKFTNLTKTKVLLTTEKDASKLNISKLEGIAIFTVPIQIVFHQNTSGSIDQEILQYVKSYQGKH